MTNLRRRTVTEIAEMICGDGGDPFVYRRGIDLSEFFRDLGMPDYVHDGSTRKWWVVTVLEDILAAPLDTPALPNRGIQIVIQGLMDRADDTVNDPERTQALAQLNKTLARDKLEAFYAADGICYLRNTATGDDGLKAASVDRALSEDEIERQKQIESFIDAASEDDFTEKVVAPLLQTLRFQRVSVTGHKDKALEFGMDMWMKHRLPMGHWLYFGIQIKRGKIDSAAGSRSESVAKVHNQVTMMLGHKVFDPDTNKKHLVDHAIIVAGGEITKQAKYWLAEQLNASQRSQIIFMDREDIVRLFVVHNVPMPFEDDDNGGSDVPF